MLGSVGREATGRKFGDRLRAEAPSAGSERSGRAARSGVHVELAEEWAIDLYLLKYCCAFHTTSPILTYVLQSPG